MSSHRSHNSGIIIFALILILIAITNTPGTAQSLVPEGAVLEHLESGFQLCEGPFWHPDGYLLFSDVWSSITYMWTEEDGLVTFLTPTGQINGMVMDLEGHLVVAQHQARQIGRIEDDKTITPIVTQYNGKRFHSPNDLVVKSDGAIFFTDPPWGGNPAEINFHGVYRIPPGRNEAQLLVSDITYPNGIAFSPDESKLYVDDSDGRHIYVFDVVDDSTLANKRLFAKIAGTQGGDGMEIDSAGNLWVAGSVGVVVYSPEGVALDSIAVTGSVTNLTRGGENGQMLYICGFNNLCRIDLTDPTGVDPKVKKLPKKIKLNQNFPNPFNPATTIPFVLPEESHVKLSVYNVSGQIVDVLLNENLEAGRHLKNFDASRFSSGFYFYELLAGDQRMIGKMQLVK